MESSYVIQQKPKTRMVKADDLFQALEILKNTIHQQYGPDVSTHDYKNGMLRGILSCEELIKEFYLIEVNANNNLQLPHKGPANGYSSTDY